jgi:hypothetical protein
LAQCIVDSRSSSKPLLSDFWQQPVSWQDAALGMICHPDGEGTWCLPPPPLLLLLALLLWLLPPPPLLLLLLPPLPSPPLRLLLLQPLLLPPLLLYNVCRPAWVSYRTAARKPAAQSS